MYFDELDLNDNVLDALYDMRFDTCTPVQEKCIPETVSYTHLDPTSKMRLPPGAHAPSSTPSVPTFMAQRS